MSKYNTYLEFFYNDLSSDEMRKFYAIALDKGKDNAKEYLAFLAEKHNCQIGDAKEEWPMFSAKEVSRRKYIDILASKGITKDSYLPQLIKPIEPRDDFNDAISYALQNKERIHREMLDKVPVLGVDYAKLEAHVMANYGEQVSKMLEVMYGDSRIVLGPRFLYPHEEAPLINPLLLLC